MATKLYAKLGTTSAVATTGYLAAWNATLNAGYAGSGARYLDRVIGASQTSVQSAGADGTSTDVGLAQCISDPLLAQAQIAAQNWTVGYALAQTANDTMSGAIYIALIKSDGTLRTAIRSLFSINTNMSSTNSERTIFSSTVAGIAFTPQLNDRILVEFGVDRTANTGTKFTFYTSGATEPSASNVVTADCATFVTCPTTLSFAPTFTWQQLTDSGISSMPMEHFQRPEVIGYHMHRHGRLWLPEQRAA